MTAQLYTAEYHGPSGHYWLRRKTMAQLVDLIAAYFPRTKFEDWQIEEVE